MFWNEKIFYNKKIKEYVLKESWMVDIRIKKLIIIEELEKEELKKQNENKNLHLDDGDWSSYKKNSNDVIFGDFRKKGIKKKMNLLLFRNSLKLLKNLKHNVSSLNNGIFLLEEAKILKPTKKLLNYYNNLNLNRIKSIESETYFKNLDKNIIILVDIRNMKPRITVIYKNKCILTVTSGIIYNKLKLKKKSIKKTQKIFSLMIKLTISSIKKKIKSKNFIINIKGTKSKLSNLVLLIKKNFDKKNDKILFVYSPFIDYKLKFKKIKSIKRRLKKKIIRFK